MAYLFEHHQSAASRPWRVQGAGDALMVVDMRRPIWHQEGIILLEAAFMTKQLGYGRPREART